MDKQLRQTALNIAIKSFLICGAISHTAFAQEQPSNTDLSVLPTITVKADTQDEKTEGSGSYKANSSRSSSKLKLSLKETPQSVSVVTREQIEQRGLTILDDVLAATPGVTATKNDSERSNYYSRGFAISNRQIDGMPVGDNAPRFDSFFFDRIEVVKGASGLTGSTGSPSATINMVRKRPEKEFKGNVSSTYGSWDNTRVEADISIPLTQDGSVRSRFMAAYTDKESYMDRYKLKSTAAMGIISADLTANTTASVGFQYQDNAPKGSTWGTVPYFNADGSKANFSRNFSLSADWSSIANTDKTVFADIEHTFANDWLVKAAIAHSTSDNSWIVAYGGSGFPDPSTGKGLSLWSMVSPYAESKKLNIDFYATGPFQFLNRQHDLIIGYSGFKSENTSLSVNSKIAYPAAIPDYREWTGNIPKPTYEKNGAGSTNTTELYGLYSTLRLNLADPLKLILGARYSSYDYKVDKWDPNAAVSPTKPRDFDQLIPYAGILYDINDTYTAYTSYTKVFNPATRRDRFGDYLDPEMGSTSELGIKADLLDGKLLTSAALFWSDVKDLAVEDVEYREGVKNGTIAKVDEMDTAYMSTGKGLKVDGFELEAIGKLQENWNLSFGYTYVNSVSSANANALSNIPQNQVKLFSSYTLPENLWSGSEKLTIGGGVNWQSEISQKWGGAPANAYNGGVVTQKAYYLANAFASYKLSDELTASLNINNLFDEKYYLNVGFYNGVYWGEPRNVTFTLRAKF
ncbi:TonB-dependent siderophore receptor [Acinetobacter sp.]|jgi:outer membrane receptor for ferric coprogen and ferric-rhodotorulic acid|uniref:TonB-dependent siderophore receptor n=1 Tax=Acinetobacter sp. TaxID=472 RepID=UPI002818E07B|nr:TonB-dependent siderophore receptor [Acinetobacter sp.]MDR0235342.1 TonB-dependent siderophore receptor [Acinetobacter sp.]